jgi:ubiquinone/menaquinone biosynthesis C-methylase UbiE
MSASARGFDRVARWYRALEFVAFGGDLERARFAFLDRLSDRRDILILGEGDGRCAERLLALAPQARITCVDSSRGMIDEAETRIRKAGGGDRVSLICADARDFAPEAGRHDAVVTLFILDCFTAGEVASIVARVGAALSPGAPWVFSDFTLPPRGIARLRARAWLRLLYAFFRWETALAVSSLPPSEEILEEAGWRRSETRGLQWGLLRSSVYRRPH